MKKVSILEIGLLLLALVSLIVIVTQIGFSLWFWIFFVVWIVLFALYLFTEIFIKLMWLFWIIFVIWLVLPISLSIGGVVGEKTGTTSSSGGGSSQVAADETVDCLFGPDGKPEAVAGYVADVFASEKKEIAVGEKRVSAKTTSFKLSNFTLENEPSLKETVYFTIYGDSYQFIPGITSAIQLCNAKTGKTTLGNDLTYFSSSPTTDNTKSVESNFSWVQAPKSKGKYYIDGVAKFSGGNWKLLDRLEIEFK